MIRVDDKLSTVLARDERLLNVLTAAAPSFESLRNPSLRKNMASRVTVEQAAQIAGLDAAALVERLNRAFHEQPPAVEPSARPRPNVARPPVPAELLATPPELLFDLDVRDDLRSGVEPFARIMSAARALPPDGVLRIRAIFEPAPLYRVFGKKGLGHFTEQLASDDWRVWFFRSESSEPSPVASTLNPEEDVIFLDVRDLEPPEPMVQTLEVLATMPRGKTLVQLNVRVPQFLLPKLDEQGFAYEIREQSSDLVRLFIRHKPN